ncbi:MAG: heme exporter protein CcmB [Acidimicrobiales bacterium]
MRDALLVAGKDLRIEARSRVATNQVVPFALMVLILFGFALDAERATLARVAGGLFWVAVLFSTLLALGRSFAVETADDASDGLKLSGLDAAGIFLGKAGAIAVQLLGLEVVLGLGVVVFYDVNPLAAGPAGAGVLAATAGLATMGLAGSGVVYGMVAAGIGVRETLLPLLVLPALAPVLLSASRATDAALAGTLAESLPWLRLLGVFATVYLAFGVVAFGALLEEA